MGIKGFLKNVMWWLLAIPMGLHLVGFTFGADSLGQVLTPLILKYQVTSAAMWIEFLGDGAKGPREHMFLTFTAFIFFPSLIFLAYVLLKYRNLPLPVIHSGIDFGWFGVNFIGTFVLFQSLVQKYFLAASTLVAILLMITFLVRYIALPGGNELFFQRFTPPKREGDNEFLRRAAPWLLLAMIAIQVQTMIMEFPTVESGRWIYVLCVATQIWIIILTTILKNRLPALVFLVCFGVFAAAWINENVVNLIRSFSNKWGIS